MGYTTEFKGQFNVHPQLSLDHFNILCEFAADNHRNTEGAPDAYCQWVPTSDGKGIEWDGGEKFYEYIPWIKYLIKTFLGPWGYTLNGEVHWEGEISSDYGTIIIRDNEILIASMSEDRCSG